MSTSVIVAGARTPIGRLLGGLKDQSAADLGGVAIKGALDKAGVSGEQVEYVIMGQVIQAGTGQITARQAAVKGGIPMDVPAITINKVCLSGINAIALADQLIRAGEHEIVVAGGMESMTQRPAPAARARASGFKYGDTALVDSMAYDALYDQFTDQAMINLTEGCNAAGTNLTREEQDAFSAQSHQRAAEAWKNGVFDDEVVPVTIPSRKGDITVSQDEGVRGDTTVESLSGLRPVVQGRHHHRRLRLADLRRRLRRGRDEQGQGRGARPHLARRDRRLRPGRRPRLDPPAPAGARHREGRRQGGHRGRPTSTSSSSTRPSPRSASSRPASSASSEDKVNVNGGAIALGHPVGMSGARIVLHLALELQRRGGGTGAAALCGGGGQGDALIIRVPQA